MNPPITPLHLTASTSHVAPHTTLTEGTLHVERADAPELLDIKRGAWPLDKVKAEAERLFQLAQEAYVRSPLPPDPDRPRAERLCVELISDYHALSLK